MHIYNKLYDNQDLQILANLATTSRRPDHRMARHTEVTQRQYQCSTRRGKKNERKRTGRPATKPEKKKLTHAKVRVCRREDKVIMARFSFISVKPLKIQL